MNPESSRKNPYWTGNHRNASAVLLNILESKIAEDRKQEFEERYVDVERARMHEYGETNVFWSVPVNDPADEEGKDPGAAKTTRNRRNFGAGKIQGLPMADAVRMDETPGAPRKETAPMPVPERTDTQRRLYEDIAFGDEPDPHEGSYSVEEVRAHLERQHSVDPTVHQWEMLREINELLRNVIQVPRVTNANGRGSESTPVSSHYTMSRSLARREGEERIRQTAEYLQMIRDAEDGIVDSPFITAAMQTVRPLGAGYVDENGRWLWNPVPVYDADRDEVSLVSDLENVRVFDDDHDNDDDEDDEEEDSDQQGDESLFFSRRRRDSEGDNMIPQIEEVDNDDGPPPLVAVDDDNDDEHDGELQRLGNVPIIHYKEVGF